MTSVSDTLNKITDRLQASATTKTVYGDPVSVDGRTLIPVARVRYGFGAGGGNGGGDSSGEGSGGGGGGGGVEVTPIGLVEITELGTRCISLESPRIFIKYALIAMGIIALIIGILRLKR
ncbi:MAG: spore germination protein GerW family protein [Dehalococcoidia bacterium]|nr:spore germination protein GerW family protein [Dehalococcoidia bacterium]